MTEPTTEPIIRLYDTMRREKVEFRPIDPSCVRMYVCGPTVYDYAHIGNARPAIVFDVLFRLLRHVYGTENVVYVRNITDVDDKIIERAQRDYPDTDLNEAIRHVTETTARQYQEDMAALGCLPPTHEPRATENIPQMIALVEDLLRRGHAYEATGEGGREVLFDVTSMPDYGALSNRKIEDQRAGARVEAKDHKRNAADFVLWKQAHEGEPGWDSPFGRGRPGWHLECSAMSDRFLWENLRERVRDKSPHVFDIHGGGIDLTFPHHENEIAQSRCAHGTGAMANVWMHNGYLQLEGRKMSKSEGNFVTIHDLLHTEKFGARRWPGEVLRLAMLMTHYREPIDFSVRRLEEAEKRLNDFHEGGDFLVHGERSGQLDEAAEHALLDDLDTVDMIQQLGVRASYAFDENSEESEEAGRRAAQLVEFLGLRQNPLAAFLASTRLRRERKERVKQYSQRRLKKQIVVEAQIEIERRINDRLYHLANRNFAEADRIRDELAAEGIQLMDYKDPETGERRTKWEVKR